MQLSRSPLNTSFQNTHFTNNWYVFSERSVTYSNCVEENQIQIIWGTVDTITRTQYSLCATNFGLKNLNILNLFRQHLIHFYSWILATTCFFFLRNSLTTAIMMPVLSVSLLILQADTVLKNHKTWTFSWIKS